MAGYSAHPPPSSSNQGSGGTQQGPLSSWADLIPPDWELAGRWSVMFLPRRMIKSMLHSALAWAVFLSLCGRRCYTERPWLNGRGRSPWHTQQRICQLGSVHKCPSYCLDQGCRISVANLLVLHHHQFLHPRCIKLLACLEWCGCSVPSFP